MDIPPFDKIRHGSGINAIAISHDEKLIACGGFAPAPITVWDLSSGEMLTQVSGFTGQIQSMAFSPDSSRIAAANVFGGFWVWNLKDGLLAHHKDETNSRRIPSLVFPANARNNDLPVTLLDSIHRGPSRKLSPNGKFLATRQGFVSVTKYKTKTELYRLDCQKYEVAKTGVRYLNWSADSKLLALTGDDWAGCWAPAEGKFFGGKLPSTEFVYDVAVLSSTRQILYTIGKPTLLAMELPTEPLLTEWEARYKGFLTVSPTDAELKSRDDWNWNVNQWGHEGVSLQADGLLWYGHRHNTMDGGTGAQLQSLASFLEEGPTDKGIPEDVLGRLCRAVNLKTTKHET
ncbi:MAG: WD40 repeat domain-containing protein [Acidobacteriota bacterium]|nr:WD40 repeat domain-containing protein [Acidobacteriota bacterium]